MDEYLFIQDELIEREHWNIIREKKPLILYYFALLDGILCIGLGLYKKISAFGFNLSYVFLVTGVLFIIIGIFRVLFPVYGLKHVSTGTWLRYRFFYLNEENIDYILMNYNMMGIKSILNFRSKAQTSFTLDIYHFPDGSVFFYQINLIKNKKIIPLTDVQVLKE